MARSKKSAQKAARQAVVAGTVKAGGQKFACYLRRNIKNQHTKRHNKVFCYEVG